MIARSLWTAAAICLVGTAATAAEPKPLFEDRFDGKMDKEWRWLRENKGAWRLTKEALEIRVEPGVAQTVKNALVRKAPDRSKGGYIVEVTVSNLAKPTNQYEQAGITWYVDGKPIFKIVKELIDGKIYVIPGKVPVEDVKIQLRVVVTADSFIAQFRPEGKGEFKTAEKGKLAPPEKDEVSIQCYNGPADAEHWMRFDDFRILPLEEKGGARDKKGEKEKEKEKEGKKEAEAKEKAKEK